MDPRNLRIGQGYDVHQLVEGRKLIMGGVDIPHTRGLLGHSDADVLAHAVADALLGGVRGGDIGKLFPDTDPAYEGADSMKLLAAVAEALGENCVSGRFLFPFDKGGVLARVRELGGVKNEEYTAEGIAADIRLDKKYIGLLEQAAKPLSADKHDEKVSE